MSAIDARKNLLKGHPDHLPLRAALGRSAGRDSVVQVRRQLDADSLSASHSMIMASPDRAVNPCQRQTANMSEEIGGSALGELIRARRVAEGLTQADLGQEIGIAQRTVSAIEDGRIKTIAPDVANRLVSVLPITMAELLQAMGYAITRPESWLKGAERAMFESLDEDEQRHIRATLRGYLWQHSQARRSAEE